MRGDLRIFFGWVPMKSPGRKGCIAWRGCGWAAFSGVERWRSFVTYGREGDKARRARRGAMLGSRKEGNVRTEYERK